MTPTERYHVLELLPPCPEPTERHKAKAISIAAVRRAVRNEKRAKWAESVERNKWLQNIFTTLKGKGLTPRIFEK